MSRQDACGKWLRIIAVDTTPTQPKLSAVNQPISPPPICDSDLFDFLLQNTPDLIYFKDREGRFLRVSRVMAKILGVAHPEDLIGRSDADLHPSEFAREYAGDEQRILETGESMIGKVEKFIRPDGSVGWNHTTKLPLKDRDGRSLGICGLNKDISALHEVQEQLTIERNRLRALNAQLAADLQLAREVQLALLPSDYPAFAEHEVEGGDRFHFAHCYRPASAVGGDFYDIFPLSPTRVGIFICDVMGHGMRAALVTAIIRGLLEELRPKMHDPREFMEALNQRLRAILQRVDVPFVATAFYMIADSETAQVSFANAAHPSPVYLSRDRTIAELLSVGAKKSGPGLGLFDKAVYEISIHRFEARDRIILYTDGLFEVDSPDGTAYGQASLVSSIARLAGLPSEDFFKAIQAEVLAFSATEEFEDDVCILSLAGAEAKSAGRFGERGQQHEGAIGMGEVEDPEPGVSAQGWLEVVRFRVA